MGNECLISYNKKVKSKMLNNKNLIKPIVLIFSSYLLLANSIALDHIYDPWENFQENDKQSSTTFNFDELKSILISSPKVEDRTHSEIVINIPLRNGEKAAFRFYETSVMHSNLADRYPNIQSFYWCDLEKLSSVFFSQFLFFFHYSY